MVPQGTTYNLPHHDGHQFFADHHGMTYSDTIVLTTAPNS